jgi:hypothetical protein
MLLLFIVESMPSLDLAMPIALFLVVIVALFLNKRVGSKLMATVEQKELKTRDVLLLVVFIVIAVSVIAFTSMVDPGGVVPNVLLLLFLTSYSTLLFTFSYLFTNVKRTHAQLVSLGFGISGLIMALLSFIGPLTDAYTIYRVAAFFVFSAVCFAAVAYENKQTVSNHRWYVAAQPPALFVLIFVFFAFLYQGTFNLWFPILMDVFGFTFAVMIILYLSSIFTWKTACIFAAVLPVIDSVLVFTGPMVTAARAFTGLGLPSLVYLPNIPIILKEGSIGLRGLGLGDFFFAGILVVQTFNKFGKKTAVISALAIAVAFGIWEAFLPDIFAHFNLGGFPATTCIISGWLPVVAWKWLSIRSKKDVAQPVVEQPAAAQEPIDKKSI